SGPPSTAGPPLRLRDALPIWWSRFRLREAVSSRVSVRPGWPVGGREAPVGGRGRLVARPSRATWPLRPHRHARASQESKTDMTRSEEHTSELQSRENLVCRPL